LYFLDELDEDELDEDELDEDELDEDELDEDELDEDELDDDSLLDELSELDELLDELLLELLDEDEELDELLEQRSAGVVLLSRQKGSSQRLLSMHPHSTDSWQGSQVLPPEPVENPQSISADFSVKLNSLHPQSSSVPL
jgi:hypothetical protein